MVEWKNMSSLLCMKSANHSELLNSHQPKKQPTRTYHKRYPTSVKREEAPLEWQKGHSNNKIKPNTHWVDVPQTRK